MTDTLTLCRPDDWHLHLRDAAARYLGRAIIMPNLTPPATDAAAIAAYRQRICSELPTDSAFEPLMTLYLTDQTSAESIRAARAQGVVAAKLYPAGATTNSASGVTDIERIIPALEAMAETGMLLLVHGEVTDSQIDIFDREKVFIDQKLIPLVERLPQLKVVMEHITTKDAADFVRGAGSQIGATLTPQHLMFNRNHMLVGGIKPHYFCLPILKRNTHQLALQDVAVSGNPKFFLGTDSAPHARGKKESACGCAGCYTAYAPIELYAEIFEELGALDKLEAFASHFGPDFYGLARNSDTITLVRREWQVPESLDFGQEQLVPLCAGQTLHWQVQA